jgi:hypothetical protein
LGVKNRGFRLKKRTLPSSFRSMKGRMGKLTLLKAEAINEEQTVRVGMPALCSKRLERQRRGRTAQGKKKRARSSRWRTSYSKPR